MQIDENKTTLEYLNELKTYDEKLITLGMEILKADRGRMYPIDLVAIAVIKRTLSNTDAFINLIETKNMVIARTLLRIQLDSFLRFYALDLVTNPNELATHILNGKQINRIKDRNGNKMHDAYLVKTLTKDIPWLERVYKITLGYIHLSDRHLFNYVEKVEKKENVMSIKLAKEDNHYPEFSWKETIECFRESINILIIFLNGWFDSKSGKIENKV